MSKARFVVPPPQDDRFKDTVFLVHATSFERLCLWNEWNEQVVWEDQSLGCLGQIGTLDRRPVTLEVFWARIDGRLVGFWDVVSQVADYKMAERWFEKNCNPRWDGGSRHARSNAMNFHFCIQAVRELNSQDGVSAV